MRPTTFRGCQRGFPMAITRQIPNRAARHVASNMIIP
jgi:hypothetical protein